MNKVGVCVNGCRYYFVMFDKDKVCICLEGGDCNWVKFILLFGFGFISEYGGVIKEDLIFGFVNMWVVNGC